MRPVLIAPELALRAVRKAASAMNVELILPDDPRRVVLAHLMGASRALVGYGWTTEEAQARVSVTLPGLGAGSDVLAALSNGVPIVGGLLSEFIGQNLKRTSVFLSPFALETGVGLFSTWSHESGHVGYIARGGIPFCLAYTLVPEVRATEATCFACNMAHDVLLRGVTVEDAAKGVRERLAFYGLDDDARALAERTITSTSIALGWRPDAPQEFDESRAFDPTGTVEESLAMARSEGWSDGND